MRRTEVTVTVMESIKDHFPADVFFRFRQGDLDQVARLLQDEGKDDYGAIDSVIRRIVADTPGWKMDDLADGEISPVATWLYEQIERNR